MNHFLLPLLYALVAFSASQSHASHSHFGAGGIFELDLGDSEIPLTPKQEKEQKLLEEQLKKKTHEQKQTKQIQHNK